MSRHFFCPSFPFAASFAAVVSCLGSIPLTGQTLEDGLDNPATLTPITTESALLDETDLPSGEWVYTTGTTHDGADAIISTLPNRSNSRLDTTVEGPATVSFWWKTSGGNTTGFDKFQFSSRNDFTTINGNTDWQQRSFEVDTGSQPLIWFFERFSSSPEGTAQAWLDELLVTPIPNSELLQAAVENTTYTLHSTDWTSGALAGAVNSTVAKSGEVDPGDISTMVFEIEGPATVKFRWGMTADESDESRLFIRVNNQIADQFTGPRELVEQSLDLGPGTHGIKFTFERGYNTSPEYAGPTEGYVDQLIVTEYEADAGLADAIDREGGVYSNGNSWTRQTQMIRDGSDAAMVTAPVLNKSQRIYIELPDGPGLLSFWYKMDVDPTEGYLYALVDGEQLVNQSRGSDWTKVEANLGSGFDRVLQLLFIRYQDLDSNSPNTKAYLDAVTFTPGATNYQPDLSIGPLKKRLKGAGVYNSTGAGQIATIRAPLARPIGEYVIRVQNSSGTDRDTIALRGIGSRRHFRIYYVVEEGGEKLNYSAAFASGIFTTAQLDPRVSEAHEIWITPKRKKLKKRSHVLRIIGTSEADPRKIDVVRTKLIVKKR